MHARAIGALALVGIGVVLGAVAFRSDIAQATGLAQRVTIANTAAIPTRASGVVKNHQSLTLEYLNGEDDRTFPEIRASLITLTADSAHTEWLSLRSKGQGMLFYQLAANQQIVLPLSPAMPIDEINLEACFGGTQCFANVNILG